MYVQEGLNIISSRNHNIVNQIFYLLKPNRLLISHIQVILINYSLIK